MVQPMTHPATYFGHEGSLRLDRQLRGSQWLFDFDNGYGASVIQNPYSYGGSAGKYELAVLHGGRAKTKTTPLCYATPITNDVIGWQSEAEITALLTEIAALSSNDSCNHESVR